MADPRTYPNRATGVADFDAPFNEVAKTANYTVLPADVGTRFTNAAATGAVTFTLPALKPGFVCEFLVVANQNVTISSAEGSNVLIENNASASNIAFTTPGDLIGGFLRFESNAAGTKWYVRVMSKNAFTIS